MTVQLPVNDRYIRLTPAAGTTVLDTDFPVLAAADLAVWRERAGVASLLTLNTDYSLTLIGNQSGARATLATASLAGDAYVLRGERAPARSSAFVEGQLRADDLNGEFAALTALIQEMSRDISNSLGTSKHNTAGGLQAGGRGVEGLGYLDIVEASASTPAAGRGRLQARAVSGGAPKLFWRSSTGSEVELTATGDATAAAAAAAASATAAASSATAAAASQAALNLPATAGQANKALVVNSTGTGYTLATGGGDVTSTQLNQAITDIKGGASAGADTLGELETSLNQRVSFSAAQTLSLSERLQARDNIAASPIASMSHVSPIINGGHVISQENDDNAVTGATYATDQWIVDRNGTLVSSVQRTTDAPPGFLYSLRTTITTAQASLSSGNFLRIRQPIERNRIGCLSLGTADARSFVIAGWFKSSVAGLYSVTVHDFNGSTPTFTWVGGITINAANTWEFKLVSVTAQPGGVWGTSVTGHGMSVSISLACASNLVGAAGWQSGNYYGLTGQVNLAATLNATFQFTGIVALPSVTSIRSEDCYLLQKNTSDALLECQRYYTLLGEGASGIAFSASGISMAGSTKATMRTAPAIAGLGGVGTNGVIRIGGSTETFTGYGSLFGYTNGFIVSVTSAAAFTSGAFYIAVKNIIALNSRL